MISLLKIAFISAMLALITPSVAAMPKFQLLERDSTLLEGVSTDIEGDEPDTAVTLIGVSMFGIERGTELSRELILRLTMRAPEGLMVYPDVIDPGAGTAMEIAGMAWSSLGVNLLVSGIAAGGENMLLLQVTTPDSTVLAGELYPGDSMDKLTRMVLGAAESLSR